MIPPFPVITLEILTSPVLVTPTVNKLVLVIPPVLIVSKDVASLFNLEEVVEVNPPIKVVAAAVLICLSAPLILPTPNPLILISSGTINAVAPFNSKEAKLVTVV